MAFTQATITHKFESADGSAAAGTVTFQLTKRMSNSGTTLVPSEITATLDPSGNLSQLVTSTNDVGTTPGDAMWVVTVRINNDAIMGPYSIAVPTGGGTVDLVSLLPSTTIGGG